MNLKLIVELRDKQVKVLANGVAAVQRQAKQIVAVSPSREALLDIADQLAEMGYKFVKLEPVP